jgi:hypothetical protein
MADLREHAEAMARAIGLVVATSRMAVSVNDELVRAVEDYRADFPEPHPKDSAK